ncbi:MAG: hypothetical protein H6822_10055 [Planctomycetaceae bacterium]|nr:hypothetical protein [Planctomycetales bacterium]MCB9922515.1 hypothetical protein [Planctomycetaceae bacterium]
MRMKSLLAATMLLLLFAGRNEGREWRHLGRPLSGEFGELRGDEVILDDGADQLTINLGELSKQDQAYVAWLTRERMWANRAGKQILAAFVRRDDAAVTLRRDGKEFILAIDLLSNSDQSYLESTYPRAAKDIGDPNATSPPPAGNERSTTASSAAERGPVAAAGGTTWVLRDGSSLTGTFQKLQGSLVWISHNPGETVLPINRFTASDQRQILQLAAAAPTRVDIATPAERTGLKPVAPSAEVSLERWHVWHLVNGKVMVGRFVTYDHDAVWIDTAEGRTSITFSDLALEDAERATMLFEELIAQATSGERELPQLESKGLFQDARTSTQLVNTIPSTIPSGSAGKSSDSGRGPACANCGNPGYIKPGERCTQCGVQKHSSHQLRIGEAPTQFPSVSSVPSNSSNSGSGSSFKIRGRGIAKLAIAVGLFVVSGVLGLLKRVFGSASRSS